MITSEINSTKTIKKLFFLVLKENNLIEMKV